MPIITGVLACLTPMTQLVACGMTMPTSALAFYFRNDKEWGIATKSLAICTAPALGAAVMSNSLDVVINFSDNYKNSF